MAFVLEPCSVLLTRFLRSAPIVFPLEVSDANNVAVS